MYARLGAARSTNASTIYGNLNDSFLMSGVSDDTGGSYQCIIFAPNTEGPGGCNAFISHQEDDSTTDWHKFPCLTGTSTDRPEGTWRYRFHAPSLGDCGIEVEKAVVADNGDWTIVMAGEDSVTVQPVLINGRHHSSPCINVKYYQLY